LKRRATILAALGAAALGVWLVAGRTARSTPRAAIPPSATFVPARPVLVFADPARRRTQAMVEGSLAFLEHSQNVDGSFGGPEAQQIRIGTTALACLAFMAHGDTEYRGRYHDTVERAVKFLLSCVTPTGERAGYFVASGDTLSRMHGQGFATLALAEAYGMFGVRRKFVTSADAMKKAVIAAVRIIVKSQTPMGGWFYEPFEDTHDEGSITVCMIQALRAARDAGFEVPHRSVESACEYVRKSQNPDGSFRYSLHGNPQATFELAAAACSTLIHAGRYYDRSVRAGRDYVWGKAFDEFLVDPPRGHPYYGLFYAVQMLWFDYDDDVSSRYDRMSRYHPRIVEWFEERFDSGTGVFRDDGIPRHSESDFGAVYRTALAALTLQIPESSLPIFQR
jgi:hypothetical protein